jgi:hypothetical protein
MDSQLIHLGMTKNTGFPIKDFGNDSLVYLGNDSLVYLGNDIFVDFGNDSAYFGFTIKESKNNNLAIFIKNEGEYDILSQLRDKDSISTIFSSV